MIIKGSVFGSTSVKKDWCFCVWYIVLQGGDCTSKLEAILCRLKVTYTNSISYCKDNIKCDSASNTPKRLLNNGVSIVEKLVVKLSNTPTMLFPFCIWCTIIFNGSLTITNAISKTYLLAVRNGFKLLPSCSIEFSREIDRLSGFFYNDQRDCKQGVFIFILWFWGPIIVFVVLH